MLLSLLFAAASGGECVSTFSSQPDVCYTNFDSAFYSSFLKTLPSIRPTWANDLQIYLPNLDELREMSGLGVCVDDASFASDDVHDLDGAPTYFTWVSQQFMQPVLGAMRSPGCYPKCPDESGRGCHTFQKCGINDVSHAVYKSDSALDRGHIVPNSALGSWFNTSSSTFSMCNISPQSSRLNEEDWQALESWIECMGQYKELTILAGPLFNDSFTDHCVCEDHVAGKLKCSSRVCDLGVPIPVAFWKVIIDHESDTYNTWAFIYDKAQYTCLKNFDKAACRAGPTVQTIPDAFSPGGLQYIADKMDFVWPPYFSPQDDLILLEQIEPDECHHSKFMKRKISAVRVEV